MGSVTNSDVTLQDTESVVPKVEPDHDGYTDTSASSPDIDQPDETVTGQTSQDPPPVPKRKGGRKPIYATSEERKQRNRQAQAAFRERRTEYIKQLETTIQHHEDTLQNLQQSHRTAADECLMLRYKNSLLERILLEKGIDVQAELALKGSPHLRPVRGPAITGQASPMQKAMLNRQQHVRHRPVLAPPIQTVNQSSLATVPRNFASSPTVQPTPPSQQSSPSTSRSPGFALQGGIASPTSDIQTQQQPRRPQHHHHASQSMPQALQSQQSFQQQQRPHMRPLSAHASSQPFQPPRLQQHQSAQTQYYPSSFQKHYDQLDQEYDNEMLDDMDGDEADADSFIPNFRLPPMSNTASLGMHTSQPQPMNTNAGNDGSHVSMIDPYDPMLDADPFGLTASMHFPNPYASFPQRR